MATIGKFEVVTSAWNAMKPSEIDLIDAGNAYQVKVTDVVGSAGRSSLTLSMRVPKVDKFTVFDVSELQSVEFANLSDGYISYFEPVSGSLSFWIAQGSVAVNGMFQMKMAPKKENEWPQELILNGFFSLTNE